MLAAMLALWLSISYARVMCHNHPHPLGAQQAQNLQSLHLEASILAWLSPSGPRDLTLPSLHCHSFPGVSNLAPMAMRPASTRTLQTQHRPAPGWQRSRPG